MSDKIKIIIDTDPGIDDAMAIHMAFADPRLEVVGLTTIFGNVNVDQATRNALWSCRTSSIILLMWHAVQTCHLFKCQTRQAIMFMVMKALGICQHKHAQQAPHLDAADYIIHTCRAHSGEVTSVLWSL